jgi:hypothetical protein
LSINPGPTRSSRSRPRRSQTIRTRARARVNLHVDLAALVAGDGSATIESGGVVHPEVASLVCYDSIVQAIVHGDGGHTVGIGQAARTVPEWLYRQLRERDGACTFPGCHHRRYVKAHHIRWWEWGGPTDLDNLVLVCNFHHKLIHLYGWRVELGKRAGVVPWFRPDYEPFDTLPAPRAGFRAFRSARRSGAPPKPRAEPGSAGWGGRGRPQRVESTGTGWGLTYSSSSRFLFSARAARSRSASASASSAVGALPPRWAGNHQSSPGSGFTR